MFPYASALVISIESAMQAGFDILHVLDTARAARYADVIVHRLLAAALRLLPLPDAVREREELHALTDNLNARHRGAQARWPTRGPTHSALSCCHAPVHTREVGARAG